MEWLLTAIPRIDTENKTVTVSKASVNAKNITISGDGYTLAMGSDVTKPTTSKAWAYTSSTTSANYNQTTSAGYTLSNNVIKYSGKTTKALITVTGVTSKSGISFSGKVVTVGAAALGTNAVTVSDGYTLALGSDVNESTITPPSWSLNGNTATYNSESMTAGYSLAEDGKSIIYSPAKESTALVTVNGIKAISGLSLKDNVVTVSNVAVNAKNITVSDGYMLALDSDVAEPTTSKAWAYTSSTTSAAYNQTTTAGYTLSGNVIKYSNKTTKALITVTGVTSKSGISFSGKVVTVGAAALGTNTVTVSDGYTLALGSDVNESTITPPSGSLDGTTATYYSESMTAGYSLAEDGKSIIYSATGKEGTPLATIDGVTSTAGFSVSGNIIKLAGNALSKNVSVNSDDYKFTLDSKFTKGKVFGTEYDDTINVAGSRVTLNGGAGNDSLGVSGNYNSVDGGAGHNYIELTATASNSTVRGGANNDSILSYATDTLIDSKGGKDLIGNNGSNVTINAGAADDVIINGGSEVSIAGGAGNDSINNIGDNVSIIGGTGNDIIENTGDNVVFVYTSGDGNDLIRGFNETSNLKVNNSTFSTEKKGDDLIITLNSGKITLEGAADLFLDKIPFWRMVDGSTAVFGTEKEILVTVSGVKSIYGLNLEGSVVNVSATSLNEANVTISDGYTLALDSEVETPSIIDEGGWTKSGTTATYKNAATTAGYTLASDGKSITYSKAVPVAVLATVDGVTSVDGLNVSGNIISLAATSLSKNVSVSSQDYQFEFPSKYTKAKIFGADFDDTISTAGQYVSVNGGKGDDYYIISGKYASINDGSGDNYVELGANSSNSTVRTGSGNDTVSNNSATALIDTKGGHDLIVNTGANVTIESGVGNDSIVNNGAGVLISGGDGADKIFSSGKNVTIDGGKGNDFIGGIDMISLSGHDNVNDPINASGISATESFSISGGTGDDTLVGGQNNDILIGGKDNDSLVGGNGADTFVYTVGDGNDTIADYEEEDIVSVVSGAVTFSTSGNNVIMTIKEGSKSGTITLKDANDGRTITYFENGEQKTYPESDLILDPTGTGVSLKSNYTDSTFDVKTNDKVHDYANSILTIDSAAVQNSLNIVANDKANVITGRELKAPIQSTAATATIQSKAARLTIN